MHRRYRVLAFDPGVGAQVALTLVIQLPRRVQHWLAVATGSRGLWQRHLDEELGNMARTVEAELAV
ncbi:MAG: hypothetical protein ABW252_02980 [Polyangiales bacterium]